MCQLAILVGLSIVVGGTSLTSTTASNTQTDIPNGIMDVNINNIMIGTSWPLPNTISEIQSILIMKAYFVENGWGFFIQ